MTSKKDDIQKDDIQKDDIQKDDIQTSKSLTPEQHSSCKTLNRLPATSVP